MTALFDVADVNKAAAVFNPDKLLWLNQQYLKELPAPELVAALRFQLERLGVDVSQGPTLERVAEVHQRFGLDQPLPQEDSQ